MKLTWKCKEDFLESIGFKDHEFEGEHELLQNALIIDFFDSVGIYISIEPQREFKNVYFDVSIDFELHSVWARRTQATSEGIEKANELYNEKF